MINIHELTKTYVSADGAVTALQNVNLRVAPGEIYGIVGRSGAGKTTLLRHISLLETPTSGSVVLDGKDLSQARAGELRTLRRTVGVVFQHFNLLASRTVLGNVELPLEIADVPRQIRRARANELIDLVGLSDKRAAYPAHLSGGQQQRVGIARALAADPKVLLCDEATSALDSETTAQVLDLIASINRSLGITVLLITHELEAIRRICHSAALLEGGRVIESGTLAELLARPSSTLAERILPTGLAERPLTANEALITLSGQRSQSAIISGLTRDLHLEVAVIGGGVERVGGELVSRFRLQLRPEEGELDVVKTSDYLKDRGAQVVLG